jgi:hypothetical protein
MKLRTRIKENLMDATESLGRGLKNFIYFSLGITGAEALLQLGESGTINPRTVYNSDLVIPMTSLNWLFDGASKENWTQTLEASAVYFLKLGMDIEKASKGDAQALFYDIGSIPTMAVIRTADYLIKRKRK